MSDELRPEASTGVSLAPADTPNGEQYTAFDGGGDLVVSVDVIAGTRTTFGDVFVVGYERTAGTDGAAEVWIEHDSNWLTVVRTDTDSPEPVDSPDGALRLESGESARLGLVVENVPGDTASLRESVTYRVTISNATGDDSDVGGTGGGGSGGVAGSGAGPIGGDTGTGGGAGEGSGDSPGDTSGEAEQGGGDEGITGGGGTVEDGTDSEDIDDQNGSRQGRVTQSYFPDPEATLGGFLLRTLLLLVAFVVTGAGTFATTRFALGRTESER